MNDFIELFTEFDKKFLRLIGHLVSKPKKVLSAIINDSKEYTAPFKFYSYLASFTLFIILFLNYGGSLSFTDDNPAIPEYWIDYFNSLSDLLITLVPLIGFIELILILSLLTFLLFIKSKISFFNHIKYNTYLVPLVALYLVMATGLFSLVTDTLSQDTLFFLLGIIFLVPAIIITIAYTAFEGNIFLKLLKSVFILSLSIFVFLFVFYDLEIDRIIHDRLFYSQDFKSEIVTKVPAHTKENYYHIDSLEDQVMIAFESAYDYERPIAIYSSSKETYSFYRSTDKGLEGVESIEGVFVNISMYNFYGYPLYVIAKTYDWENDRYQEAVVLSLGNDDSKVLEQTQSTFNTFSDMALFNKELYISGYNEHSLPSIYKIANDSISPVLTLDYKNSHIDEFIPATKDSLKFWVLLHERNEAEELVSISMVLCDTSGNTEDLAVKLYDNRFSSFSAIYGELYPERKIFNPRLITNSDSTRFYVFYQIMTNESFELQIHCFDTKLKELYATHYTTDYNLTHFDSYTVENEIYVQGKIYSLVNKGMFSDPFSYPFVAKFDINTGSFIGMKVIDNLREIFSLNSDLHYPLFNLVATKDSLHIFKQEDILTEIAIAKF